jgi:adenylate cyclase
MELEIERKWLTDESIKSQIVRNGFTRIQQAYLSPNTRIRIHPVGDDGGEAVITVKNRVSDLTVKEYNFPIPLDEAKELIAGMDVIDKHRFNIGLTEDRQPTGFTLDVFSGQLEGLFLIEKEYASEEEAAADELPEDWAAVEVTGDSRFINANLGDKRFDPVNGIQPRLDSDALVILEGNEEDVDSSDFHYPIG